eukprot:748152-Hanusia_phi.AAC.3
MRHTSGRLYPDAGGSGNQVTQFPSLWIPCCGDRLRTPSGGLSINQALMEATNVHSSSPYSQ